MKQNTLGYSFKHSLYITAFTDWFLGFFGRGAQFILIVTTIYQGAGLLPGLALPQGITSTVFIVQMLTLDIGGMGLARIAKQARDEGDSEGAKKTAALGKWLIRIVIATLVAAALEQIVKPLPVYQTIKPGADVFFLLVSSCLVIARAVCAVQYSVVMHSLKSHEHQAPGRNPQDIQAHLSWQLVGLAGYLQTDYRQIASDQARLIASVQQAQTAAPVIDQTAIVNAVIEHFAEQFEQGMKRLAEQPVRVITQDRTPALPEHLNSRPNTSLNSKQQLHQDRKIVRFAPGNRGSESHQETITRLLDEDEKRGPRELARLAGCSPATAKNYRDLYLNTCSERNGTVD